MAEIGGKMKVGLLNLQKCDSHGAVLLAYALEQILVSCGYEPENIDYKCAGQQITHNLVLRLYNSVMWRIKKKYHLLDWNLQVGGVSVMKEYKRQHINFENFRKKYLYRTGLITNVNDDVLNKYDAIIVGSDVVWKPDIARGIDREIYFLKSPKSDILKIAYAASIGTNDMSILGEYIDDYRDAFKCLDFISVREKSSIPFITQFTNKKVENVIDPVFLLDPDEYIKLENDSQKLESPYIYAYLIGKNEEAIRCVERYAKKMNMNVLLDLSEGFELSNILTVNCKSAISAGPSEFIYNIRHASYVITDSFHATAFALMFNIPLSVFGRGSISVRMTDLLEKFDLNSRYVTDSKIKDSASIDWKNVNEIIEKERKAGMEFLLSALSGRYETK